MEINARTLADQLPDEDAAYRLLEELRWGDQPVCPHCGHDRAYFLTPKAGPRTTRTGKVSHRRIWKCAKCRKQFSVLTGTIFHGSKVPVRTWICVVYEMCASKNGLACREVERKYGLTPKTAWFVMHRIREAMKAGELPVRLVGHFEADEAYIGGDPRNRHAWQRKEAAKRGRGTDKAAVFSVLHTDSGQVFSRVIPTVDGRTIRDAIKKIAEPKGSMLATDSWSGYLRVAPEFDGHGVVNHSAGEYVNKLGATTNHVEGYFSQLKRSIDGTHHAVSAEHLDRYLAEFDYRYGTRKMSDGQRMERLMAQTGGRRLTYRETVGR